jgi:hypothetical protein
VEMLVGGLVWVALLAVAAAAHAPLPLVEALVALGLIVVVPGATALHPAAGRSSLRWALIASGALAGGALLLPAGRPAAALAVPWVLTALVLFGAAVRRSGGRRLMQALWVAPAAYLVVGSLWLAADRLALEPGGFGPPLVLLTAVHFHYAGFVSGVLAIRVLQAVPDRRLSAVAAAGTVSAPPMVAAGFALLPALQVVGAVVLTAALLALGWVVLRDLAPHAPRVPGVLLATSAVAVVAPMVLAIQWALGYVVGTPALSIPDMARYHGAVNAIGFALAGVAGLRCWRAAPSGAERSGPQRLQEHDGRHARQDRTEQRA